mmetsp:Transcript_170621/g.547277  ORF Transcript_170621/g.547277 Transcript_170621/m.547277 type:complete len:206 (+) Transcript_170621:705-1322(+)
MAGGRRSSSWMFGRPLPLSSRSLGDRSICSRSSRSNRSSSCCRSNHCSPGSRRSPVGQSPLRLPHRHRLLCLVTRAAQLRMLAAGGPEVKTTPSQHGLGPWRTGLPAAAADLPRSIHSTVGGRRWLPMMVPVRRLRRPREHLAPCPRHVGSNYILLQRRFRSSFQRMPPHRRSSSIRGGLQPCLLRGWKLRRRRGRIQGLALPPR